MLRKPAALALALLAGGCMPDWFGDTAPSQWRNPNRPQAQWAKDEEACRKWATAEAEKEGNRDAAIATDRGDEIGGHAGSYGSASAAQDVKRRRAKLTHECMTARGYQRVQR